MPALQNELTRLQQQIAALEQEAAITQFVEELGPRDAGDGCGRGGSRRGRLFMRLNESDRIATKLLALNLRLAELDSELQRTQAARRPARGGVEFGAPGLPLWGRGQPAGRVS